MGEDLFCLLCIHRGFIYVCLLCITSPSVNRIFKLAIFGPFMSLRLFPPSCLCLPHLILYLNKHILGAQVSFISISFSPVMYCFPVQKWEHSNNSASSLKWPEQINFNQRIVSGQLPNDFCRGELWPWVLQQPQNAWYGTIRLYSSIFLMKTPCYASAKCPTC